MGSDTCRRQRRQTWGFSIDRAAGPAIARFAPASDKYSFAMAGMHGQKASAERGDPANRKPYAPTGSSGGSDEQATTRSRSSAGNPGGLSAGTTAAIVCSAPGVGLLQPARYLLAARSAGEAGYERMGRARLHLPLRSA